MKKLVFLFYLNLCGAQNEEGIGGCAKLDFKMANAQFLEAFIRLTVDSIHDHRCIVDASTLNSCFRCYSISLL